LLWLSGCKNLSGPSRNGPQVFDQVGKSLPNYKPWTTGALNAKSRQTKNSRSTENTYRGKERPATSRG